MTFWNSPEGHLSIVTDHMNGGLLSDLLNSVGGLPETVLRDVMGQVAEALA